jgi:hypothetical protein
MKKKAIYSHIDSFFKLLEVRRYKIMGRKMFFKKDEDIKNLRLFSQLRTKVSITKDLGIYILIFNVIYMKFLVEHKQYQLKKITLIFAIISFILLSFYLKFRINAQSLVENRVKEKIFTIFQKTTSNIKEISEIEYNNLWRFVEVKQYNEIMKEIKKKFPLYYNFYWFERCGFFFLFFSLFLYIKLNYYKEVFMGIFSGVNLSDIVLIFSLILAFIGLMLNYFQMKKEFNKQKAEFLNNIFTEFYSDKDIKEAFYLIEYGEFNYDSGNFHGSELEKKIDKLLFYFDKIGKLYKMNVLTMKEISVLEYEMSRVLKNRQIKNYCEFLDKWYQKNNIDKRAFNNYRELDF